MHQELYFTRSVIFLVPVRFCRGGGGHGVSDKKNFSFLQMNMHSKKKKSERFRVVASAKRLQQQYSSVMYGGRFLLQSGPGIYTKSRDPRAM